MTWINLKITLKPVLTQSRRLNKAFGFQLVGSAWRTVLRMTWSVRWVHMRWSTSCCLFPSASQPARISSGWWPTHRTAWFTPGPPSCWWTRTPRYRLAYEIRTWREFCSPQGRYESPTRTASRSEPSFTARTGASSTKRPSSFTSLSLPTLTESTLNGLRWRCGDKLTCSTPGWEEHGANERRLFLDKWSVYRIMLSVWEASGGYTVLKAWKS